jgi:hypothetical protein
LLLLVNNASGLQIATASLPQGQVGLGYTATLSATGGTPGYVWDLLPASGNLPNGLTIASNGTILGYGPYHYKYASGLEGDSPIVGLSSRKLAISLYISGHRDGRPIAEAAAASLGKVSVGKVCICFKKLEDLNLPVALELIREASTLIDKQGGDFSL